MFFIPSLAVLVKYLWYLCDKKPFKEYLLMALSEFNSFYSVILQMTAELFCEIYNSRSPLYIIPLYILAWLYQTIFLQAVRILW